MTILQPEPGDTFTVPGRRDLLAVAQKIAAFEDHAHGTSLYLVQTPAGARWVLRENPSADGPRWVGEPVPAETTEP